MKTLNDVQREMREEEKNQRAAHAARCAGLFEGSMMVPPYVSPHGWDKTNYVEMRARVRELLLHPERVELYETACDHCRTRLINPQPGAVLLSSPPLKRAACPGCGWWGSVPTRTP